MRFQTPDAERFLFFFLLILAFHDCCKWQLQEGQGQGNQDQDRGYGLINNADCRSPIGTRTSGSGRSPILPLPRYVEGSNREVQTEELSVWVKKSLAIHLRAVIKEVIKV